jgi:Tir chaperone protein (CesT).
MRLKDVAVGLSRITGKAEQLLDNAAVVSLGDGTEIYLEYLKDRDELYMYSNVATVSEDRLGKYALSMLKANHLGNETGGSAVLAYDPDESRVVVWDRMSLSATDENEFRERFSLMYLARIHWANRVRKDLLGGDNYDVAGISAALCN